MSSKLGGMILASTSRVKSMRPSGELRVEVDGRPFIVLYAFDPRRAAILLIGGDKTGDARWYEANVPTADRLNEEHIEDLERGEEQWLGNSVSCA
jgi:hypothetical protein